MNLNLTKLTAPDKLMHAITGCMFYCAAHFFMPLEFALGIVVAAAILKELYDKFHPKTHTVEFLDGLATTFGGVLGYLCSL